MKVLIGSKALKHWYPDFHRSGIDTDYVTNDIHTPNGERIEYHYNKAFEFLGNKDIADPNELYTIKVSHSFWNIHWRKTMDDIRFMQEKGCVLLEDFYSLLYNEWIIKHGEKRAYLDIDNESFFTSNIDRKYNHDDIHNWVKYYDEPMFMKVKSDLNKALISKSLFDQLDHGDKLKLCREEIYVMALERIIIPNDFSINTRVAYERAARILITSASKGWFPKFIVTHWNELYKPDSHDFVGLFKKNIAGPILV
jgi:hypothetical protein